jgi:hypothetical protein
VRGRHAPSPVFFGRRRVRRSPNCNSSLPIEGSGAPADAGACEAPDGWPARPSGWDVLRSSRSSLRSEERAFRRSTCGVLCPLEPCFRAATDSPFKGSLVRERWPPLRRRRHVQPFKAAGRNAGGRLARASRGLSYEPRPRAPHQHDRVSPILSGETTRPHLRPHPSPLLRPRHVSGDAPRRAGRAKNRHIAAIITLTKHRTKHSQDKTGQRQGG